MATTRPSPFFKDYGSSSNAPKHVSPMFADESKPVKKFDFLRKRAPPDSPTKPVLTRPPPLTYFLESSDRSAEDDGAKFNNRHGNSRQQKSSSKGWEKAGEMPQRFSFRHQQSDNDDSTFISTAYLTADSDHISNTQRSHQRFATNLESLPSKSLWLSLLFPIASALLYFVVTSTFWVHEAVSIQGLSCANIGNQSALRDCQSFSSPPSNLWEESSNVSSLFSSVSTLSSNSWIVFGVPATTVENTLSFQFMRMYLSNISFYQVKQQEQQQYHSSRGDVNKAGGSSSRPTDDMMQTKRFKSSSGSSGDDSNSVASNVASNSVSKVYQYGQWVLPYVQIEGYVKETDGNISTFMSSTVSIVDYADMFARHMIGGAATSTIGGERARTKESFKENGISDDPTSTITTTVIATNATDTMLRTVASPSIVVFVAPKTRSVEIPLPMTTLLYDGNIKYRTLWYNISLQSRTVEAKEMITTVGSDDYYYGDDQQERERESSWVQDESAGKGNGKREGKRRLPRDGLLLRRRRLDKEFLNHHNYGNTGEDIDKNNNDDDDYEYVLDEYSSSYEYKIGSFTTNLSHESGNMIVANAWLVLFQSFLTIFVLFWFIIEAMKHGYRTAKAVRASFRNDTYNDSNVNSYSNSGSGSSISSSQNTATGPYNYYLQKKPDSGPVGIEMGQLSTTAAAATGSQHRPSRHSGVHITNKLSLVQMILPEQYVVAALLLCIALWQGPVGSFFLLRSYYWPSPPPATTESTIAAALGTSHSGESAYDSTTSSSDSITVTNTSSQAFISALMRSLGLFGVLCCYVVYIDGLKFSHHENILAGCAGNLGSAAFCDDSSSGSSENGDEGDVDVDDGQAAKGERSDAYNVNGLSSSTHKLKTAGKQKRYSTGSMMGRGQQQHLQSLSPMISRTSSFASSSNESCTNWRSGSLSGQWDWVQVPQLPSGGGGGGSSSYNSNGSGNHHHLQHLYQNVGYYDEAEEAERAAERAAYANHTAFDDLYFAIENERNRNRSRYAVNYEAERRSQGYIGISSGTKQMSTSGRSRNSNKFSSSSRMSVAESEGLHSVYQSLRVHDINKYRGTVVAPHHLSSSLFYYFIRRKLLFLLFSSVVAIAYWLSVFPCVSGWIRLHQEECSSIHINSMHGYDSHTAPVAIWYDVFGFFFGLCVVVWSLWVMEAVITSRRRLKALNYLQTRFRQVLLRIVIFQYVWGVILAGAFILYYMYAWDIMYAVGRFSSVESKSVLLLEWLGYFAGRDFRTMMTPAVYGSFTSSLCSVYVTCVAVALAFCVAPSAANNNNNNSDSGGLSGPTAAAAAAASQQWASSSNSKGGTTTTTTIKSRNTVPAAADGSFNTYMYMSIPSASSTTAATAAAAPSVDVSTSTINTVPVPAVSDSPASASAVPSILAELDISTTASSVAKQFLQPCVYMLEDYHPTSKRHDRVRGSETCVARTDARERVTAWRKWYKYRWQDRNRTTESSNISSSGASIRDSTTSRTPGAHGYMPVPTSVSSNLSMGEPQHGLLKHTMVTAAAIVPHSSLDYSVGAHLAALHRYDKEALTHAHSQLFCLELACLLLEASYQAYFPPLPALVPTTATTTTTTMSTMTNNNNNNSITSSSSSAKNSSPSKPTTVIGAAAAAAATTTHTSGAYTSSAQLHKNDPPSSPLPPHAITDKMYQSTTGGGGSGGVASAAAANIPTPPPSPPVYRGPYLDPERLGLSLKSTFSCEEWSTFGFVAEPMDPLENAVVVSFRGTSNQSNLLQDFNFKQIALPDLKKTRLHYLDILCAHIYGKSDDEKGFSISRGAQGSLVGGDVSTNSGGEGFGGDTAVSNNHHSGHGQGGGHDGQGGGGSSDSNSVLLKSAALTETSVAPILTPVKNNDDDDDDYDSSSTACATEALALHTRHNSARTTHGACSPGRGEGDRERERTRGTGSNSAVVYNGSPSTHSEDSASSASSSSVVFQNLNESSTGGIRSGEEEEKEGGGGGGALGGVYKLNYSSTDHYSPHNSAADSSDLLKEDDSLRYSPFHPESQRERTHHHPQAVGGVALEIGSSAASRWSLRSSGTTPPSRAVFIHDEKENGDLESNSNSNNGRSPSAGNSTSSSEYSRSPPPSPLDASSFSSSSQHLPFSYQQQQAQELYDDEDQSQHRHNKFFPFLRASSATPFAHLNSSDNLTGGAHYSSTGSAVGGSGAVMHHALNSTKACLSRVMASLPLLNQHFPRVHLGFWSSYASVREDFLRAATVSIYEHRKKHRVALAAVKSAAMTAAAAATPRGGGGGGAEAGAGAGAGPHGPPVVPPPVVNSLSIFITGHSLGAAMAVLASLDLSLNMDDIIAACCVTELAELADEESLRVDEQQAPAAGAATAAAAARTTTLLLPTQISSNGSSSSGSFKQHTNERAPLIRSIYSAAGGAGLLARAAAAPSAAPRSSRHFGSGSRKRSGLAAKKLVGTAADHLNQLEQSVRGWELPTMCTYTFGSPRLGNAAFNELVNKQSDLSMYRVAVNGDIVTMIPKIFGFYMHNGTKVLLDEEESGSIIINPSILEYSMFNRALGGVVNHSLDKYRSCLEASFDNYDLTAYLLKEEQQIKYAADLKLKQAQDLQAQKIKEEEKKKTAAEKEKQEESKRREKLLLQRKEKDLPQPQRNVHISASTIPDWLLEDEESV